MRTTTRKGGNRGGNLGGLGGRYPQSLRWGGGPCIRPPPNILRSSVVGCAQGKSKKCVFLVMKVRSSEIFAAKMEFFQKNTSFWSSQNFSVSKTRRGKLHADKGEG